MRRGGVRQIRLEALRRRLGLVFGGGKMRLFSKILCFLISAAAVALLLYWLSDGFVNWDVATWFKDLSFPSK